MDPNALFSSIASSQAPQDLTEKLQKATLEKDEGNKYFKAGDNAKAGYHYHCALMYVKGLHNVGESDLKKVNEIKISCENNLAAVHTKEGKHLKVIPCCTRVLAIDPSNVKALYRRGKAYLEEDLDKAETDLKKAAELDPADKAIHKELVLLKQRSKQQDKKQQKFYSNIFDKIQKENEEARRAEAVEPQVAEVKEEEVKEAEL